MFNNRTNPLILNLFKMRKTLFKIMGFAGMLFLLTANCFSQTSVTVSGKVTDSGGEPLPGVNVFVKGTTVGTVTDINGTYTLQVDNPAQALLVFRFVGFNEQEIAVANQSTINVTMQDSSIGLDEVVAIGYGVVRRRDLTGSVGSVKSDEIARTTTSNAMQAIQGRVPGVDIQQRDGQAGSGININLRGNRSISASNAPLILVDGVEYGSTIDINATDIESMDILKDAASTAIYGTRGANGVIIITTKKGKSGKTKVNLNSYVSSNIATHVPQVMYGKKEVQRLIDKANYAADLTSGNWGTSNFTPQQILTESMADWKEIDIYNDGSYTNWIDIILQNGLTQNYELSISGGSENTNFNLALGTMFDEGLLKNDKMNRYNTRLNLDHKINNMFKVGANLMFTYRDHDARQNSVFNQGMALTTICHPYTAEGEIIKTPNPRYLAHANPLLDEIDGAYQRNIETTRFFGNSYLEVTPVKNLTFKTMFALDRSNIRTGTYQDYESVARFQSPGTTGLSLEYVNQTNFTFDNTLNYSTKFGIHNISALVGSSAKQDVREQVITSGDAGKEHYYKSSFYDVSKAITYSTTSSYTKTSLLSYFGRLNYSLMEKYLLQASVRADGSSTLAPGNKWGYFPSVAAAWRINEEGFMTGTRNWLTNLKFRTSWGISGNAAINAYDTMGTLDDRVTYYFFGGKDIAGNLPSRMGNEKLKWETNEAYNFGLDFGILTNRISGSIDYYISKTSDLLYPKSAPPSSVFPSVITNIGSTEGNGYEIMLNTVLLNKNGFNWDINWTYSTSKDKVVSLSDGITRNITGTTGQIVGQPLSIFFNYESDGIWNVGEFAEYKAAWEARNPGKTIGYISAYGVPGTIKIIDRNDDGKLDDDDKKVYNRSPKHIFGIANNLTYKDLSLSVLVFARLGGYISYDLNSRLNFETANWGDIDYWTPTNTRAKFPNPGSASATFGSYGSSLLYEKANYVKIKDITLSYSLPKSVIKGVGIENVKVYGSLKNFFTFSSIDNYDPERGGAFTFPLAKQMVFGFNLEF